MQERADVVPKPKQLSNLFLGRGAVLRTCGSLKEIKRQREAVPVGPAYQIRPLRGASARPLRAAPAAEEDLTAVDCRRAAAGTFPLLSRAHAPPLARPKHVPPPAPPDHAAARLRSRAPPRRPLARFLPGGRRLAGGRGHASSRERCILVCPRAPPRAAPSAAPRPSRASRAARRQSRAARRAEVRAGNRRSGHRRPPPTAHRPRAASAARRAPASQHCCLQAVRHHALAGLHRPGRRARGK